MTVFLQTGHRACISARSTISQTSFRTFLDDDRVVLDNGLTDSSRMLSSSHTTFDGPESFDSNGDGDSVGGDDDDDD